MYKMIQPFIVIEATNFHEDKNHVKLQWSLLTLVPISKTRSSKIPPGDFFPRDIFTYFSHFLSSEEIKILH